jgi:hypothetical protein
VVVRSTTALLASGAAVWVEQGATGTTPIVISGTTFRDNSVLITGATAWTMVAQGGAVAVTAPTTVISNCTFVDNLARVVANSLSVRARAMGGAVAVTGALIMNNTVVRGNSVVTGPLGSADPASDGYGGGVHVNGTLRAWRVRITGNSVSTFPRSYGGGLAVTAVRSNVTVSDSRVASNTLTASWSTARAAEGAGLWVQRFGGTTPAYAVRLVRCTVAANRLTLNQTVLPTVNGYGGGVAVRNMGLIVLASNVSSNSVFGSGSSTAGYLYGGGIYAERASVVINGSRIQGEALRGFDVPQEGIR